MNATLTDSDADSTMSPGWAQHPGTISRNLYAENTYTYTNTDFTETTNTLDCKQSHVYSSCNMFSSIPSYR